MLILSAFPGVDLMGRAFEQEWPDACLVRGPDPIFGGDIRTFHPPAGVFDGIIGGPPCQCFSRLRHLVEHNGYALAENLIPEFERVVAEAQPGWWLMENVPQAPLPRVPGYIVESVLFDNRWTGAVQHRERRFSFGTPDGRKLEPEIAALEAADWQPAVMASASRPTPVAIGGNGKRKTTTARNIGWKTAEYYRCACELQGLPGDFLEGAPFTVAGKVRVVGNGVPMATGRAMARAMRRSLGLPLVERKRG